MNQFASWISSSALNDFALYVLANVPGLPPILQTIHLLAISAIMASALIFDLRILGLAVPSQSLPEMSQRLRLWTYAGVAVALLSGIVFVLARPGRYFDNPVFQIKFALLLPALLCSMWLYKKTLRSPQLGRDFPRRGKIIALISLGLWVAVVLAGRWIAYSEYLFWPE